MFTVYDQALIHFALIGDINPQRVITNSVKIVFSIVHQNCDRIVPYFGPNVYALAFLRICGFAPGIYCTGPYIYYDSGTSIFQVFASNLDPNTTSTTVFDGIFYARCVRVIPTERVGEETALRFELLGCGENIPFNTFKPHGISHSYQLDQSVSVLRVVGRYLSFYLNFKRTNCMQPVETLIRRRVLRRLIWVCTVFLCPTKKVARLIWVT